MRRKAAWLLLAASVLVLVSYLRDVSHNAAAREAYVTLRDVKVRAGSIGGWPIGMERVISFEQDNGLSDTNAELLLALNRIEDGWLYVSLQGTAISDVSIPVLAQLTTVDLLAVDGCQITARGVDELQQRLPKTRIVYRRDGNL